jgi:hypothetical protein
MEVVSGAWDREHESGTEGVLARFIIGAVTARAQATDVIRGSDIDAASGTFDKVHSHFPRYGS